MKLRTLLIDPDQETVTEMEIDGNDFHIMNQLVEARCGCIVNFRANKETYFLWLDDEGGICEPRKKTFFHPLFYPQPLSGKALVFKHGEDGNTDPCDIEVNEIADRLLYLGKPLTKATLEEGVDTSGEP